ncbi:MAG TPA: nucleotide sugar dehydrogenase [Elusimicrobiota bacterium]|nr:nucleotide sugar dehydrogenase [Elusimicrobiota bacterium]
MELDRRLKDKSARIGVVGLGYVGLPLAVEFCRKGFHVDGYEISRARLARLKAGRSYVDDVSSDDLARFSKGGLFKAHGSFASLAGCDAVFVCVQTPLRKTGEPNLGPITEAARLLRRHSKKGRLAVIESTVFPGVTQDWILPILAEGGRRLGRDFFLAFSPERVDPGNKNYGIANTPKVVGGADAESTRLACLAYAQILGDKVVPVSSSRAAEVVKLLENSFRSVNIALVNEMALICHRLGLDVWEVLSAAATKPFGFMPFYPGPGIGGHCIPKDPKLLAWKMRTLNFEPRFIELASAINGSMPAHVVERVAALLNKDKRPLNGSRVLILGVAYKSGTSDYRESPSLDVMHLLLEAKARVIYHDPRVPSLRLDGRLLKSRPLTDALLRRADCAAVLTAHRGIDYGRVARLARRVFDARNAVPAGPRVEKL